ncbi:hypothetical protein NQZ68_023039 [Dissostichus eleginoides]|nr:hypothetical protein NQZ68_023039 [Dissostichus eleginoides]
MIDPVLNRTPSITSFLHFIRRAVGHMHKLPVNWRLSIAWRGAGTHPDYYDSKAKLSTTML